MNGKSTSIPSAMIFKRHYCVHCGARLQREKTHRVVTEDDRDYFQYHERGRYPRCDYDVYGYRFRCPACETRFTFEQQCVMERLQKKHRRRVLASYEIRETYEEYQHVYHQNQLIQSIVASILFGAIIGLIWFFTSEDKSASRLLEIGIMLALVIACSVFASVRRHKGEPFLKRERPYSFEKENQLKRLHTYSTHNKKWVDLADRCHCYYCQRSMGRDEIERFSDNGQTAVCPKCGVDAILPDSIEEPLDEAILAEMHEYWF